MLAVAHYFASFVLLAAAGHAVASTASLGGGEDAAALAPGRPVASDVLALGAVAPAITFTDTRWLPRTLDDFGAKKAFVLVFTTLDCPVAQRVLPRLAELEPAFRARGVQFLAIDVGPDDELVEVAARAVDQGLAFPVARDFDGSVVRALGPTRTPEVLVLDEERRLVYRGRVDARERLAGTAAAEVRADLAEALEDVLAGRAVRVATTPVDGCRITPPRAKAAKGPPPAWSDGVRELVQERCAVCHARGKSAPFPLETWEDASAKAAMIAEVVEQGRMPPWFASRASGPFATERRLSAVERAALVAWAEGGAPRGDAPAEPEPAPADGSAWRIGAPDLVLTVPALTKLPAHGLVPYKYLILPHVFAADTWVEAVEIRPSNRRVVHHANLAWYQLGGEFRTENFITGEVPGGDAMELGPGTAFCIPKGSVLGLQVHYVTTGVEEADRISVAFRFPRAKVEKRLRHLAVSTSRLAIPPFEPAHRVQAERALDVDADGVGMFVHMHYRGRDMRFEALEPGKDTRTLLLVPNYHFDWQIAYAWSRGAVSFPKGTTIRCTAHYDNSAFNPFNPDPAREVRFGEETTDEMLFGFFFYTARDERLGLEIDPATGARRAH
ncbi:MAG: redoxin family protein [Planctomycetes bacterium]|nr:redoxin family protein [Planctomycetota bacterium]